MLAVAHMLEHMSGFDTVGTGGGGGAGQGGGGAGGSVSLPGG